MARLLEVGDAAAKRIGEWLPELKVSELHPGPFTEQELERVSTSTPAVHVAFLATRANESVGDGRRDVRAEYMASILTRSVGKDRGAEREAERIGTELLRLVPEEQWGLRGLMGARDVRLENAFNPGIAGKGMALWRLTWNHVLRLGEPDFSSEEKEDCPVPEEVHSIRDPERDADPAEDYEQVTP